MVGLADIRMVMSHHPSPVDSETRGRWSPSARIALAIVVTFTIGTIICAVVVAVFVDWFVNHMGGL